MFYTRLNVKCDPDFTEILIAELGEIGFDTFEESSDGFDAFVENENFNKSELDDLKNRYDSQTPLVFSFHRIEKKNWNEEWEKSYEPIIVDDRCMIRADFHKPAKAYPYEIIITPKMSFGTGHHQTTHLMISQQMKIDHKRKRVMDAGCGTAILSIMACKLGASEVAAFDIDEWSVINGNENIQLNNCNNIRIQQGKINDVNLDGEFDIILANINKNVLLSEISVYSKFLSKNGKLLLSGFYTTDIPDLLLEASKSNLREGGRDERDNWATVLLSKN
jgi:ribosomal protein L11 methyltransferase